VRTYAELRHAWQQVEVKVGARLEGPNSVGAAVSTDACAQYGGGGGMGRKEVSILVDWIDRHLTLLCDNNFGELSRKTTQARGMETELAWEKVVAGPAWDGLGQSADLIAR
jgi:hypothetical protein